MARTRSQASSSWPMFHRSSSSPIPDFAPSVHPRRFQCRPRSTWSSSRRGCTFGLTPPFALA
eukprot:11175446-Lingulodinium_polyedra.AAC.1